MNVTSAVRNYVAGRRTSFPLNPKRKTMPIYEYICGKCRHAI